MTRHSRGTCREREGESHIAMDAGQEGLKIFMLPWLAHGHISPYLELAKRLVKRKFVIYFCSTPVNLDAIKPTLSEDCSASIHLVEIHLQSTPELPPHYHTAKGLPIHLMPALTNAFRMAAPELETILKNLNPDLLIVDILQPWVLPLASSLNIPMIFFTIFGAVALSFMINRNVPNNLPFPEINLHDYWKSKYPHLYGDQTEPLLSFDYFEQSSDIIVIKTFREIEAQYLDFLTLSLKKKVVTAGPLVQKPSPQDQKSDIIEWLDKKEPFSTVFVSFGSEYYLSKEEMEEIAYGLEISEVNFIWVARFPMGQEIKLEEALPKGFIQRAGGRGKVIEGWAPQAQILGHSSIGGHVSHCGWSSLLESMRFGVPVIGTPMHLDNPIYARLIEEIGVGLEVKRDEKGRITRDELANIIKKVVIEKTRETFRRKAEEMRSVLITKDEEEIDGLASELVRLCEMKRVQEKH